MIAMYKYCLFLYIIMIFISCSKEDDEYETRNCCIEIKEGSSFTLCTKFGNPIEELFFEENVILFGKKIYSLDKNQYSYQTDNINKCFRKNKTKFDDLNITFVNDSIEWIKNNSSKTNFCFDNIDYFTINDSICHFRCYGEKRSHFFLYSMYDTMIRISADINIKSINN